jgi:2-polyprenyl-3-methyl-5-hydroxy-6-metoxy-1,4-benzoquinol methylase
MWDERYSSNDYIYGKEPNDFLKQTVDLIKAGEKVLCIAEGEGRNAVFVASSISSAQVTAMDASRSGLNKAQKLAKERKVSIDIVHQDLADFSFGLLQWDVIVSIWCHLPSALRKKVHRQIVNALKPNGRFILEAYTPNQLKYETGGPRSPDLLMQLEDLKQELTGLDFIIAHECERIIHEGSGHNGLSAVVQIIGIKKVPCILVND